MDDQVRFEGSPASLSELVESLHVAGPRMHLLACLVLKRVANGSDNELLAEHSDWQLEIHA